MTGTYNEILVLFSLLVAILASYTALDMACRVATTQGVAARWWLAGGAFAMGLGIWSMHFVGMLAFHLPIPLGYDIGLTLCSMLAAFGASAFALWLVSREELPLRRLLLGAVLMGTGIALMHYIGMAALQMQPGIDYHRAGSRCPSPSRSPRRARRCGSPSTCVAAVAASTCCACSPPS